MKTDYTTRMLRIAIVIAFMSSFACKNKNKIERAIQGNTNNSTASSDNTEKDVQFLAKAAELNLSEIELGKLTPENSSVANIKALGAMMEKDHAVAMNSLRTIASKKGINIPTSLSRIAKDEYYKLHTKTGIEFDLEYCDMIIDGHIYAIGLFEKASKESTDADIRAFADEMIPKLKKHLDHAMTCKEISKISQNKNAITLK